MSAMWRRVGDKTSMYLPVLIMGLLALGTWWLVRNAPKPIAVGAEKVLQHDPDYFLKDFVIKNFEADGRLKNRLNGTTGEHFPDTDTLEVDDARMLSIMPDGRKTVGSSNRALSNGDGSEIQMFGQAVITREPVAAHGSQKALPAMQLESEFLQIWPNEERVSSNKPVVMTRGRDQFTGDSMQYQHLDQILQMQGRVKGVIEPGKAK
ncbi:LPS export ABC transporter periplasmic protein LptC [Comamonas sp. Y33R10-2]|uniref:LPS export ABC transporter periplasmic protein LptC n=1 Tax=Comamonas sp. Y33R10-2 TaxID=2853257 RepID=UPI001C5C8A65|nr:LPS export ABC transporter periplasmic protein LptC [Comamonas sp. Y33R10-2]QXZ08682.1 LPS export ABC transporter periplasmic protein LptC [Comamonas sp. Y33R10-2]